MFRAFWRWLALFAYRRWARPGDPKPWGVPGNRDPEHPCTAYEPRRPHWTDWKDCMGDGHCLCRGCCHLDPKRDEKLGNTYGRYITLKTVNPEE